MKILNKTIESSIITGGACFCTCIGYKNSLTIDLNSKQILYTTKNRNSLF